MSNRRLQWYALLHDEALRVPSHPLDPRALDAPRADFVAAYTLDWANEVHLLDATPRLRSYMEKMYTRPKAPPRVAEALASVRP